MTLAAHCSSVLSGLFLILVAVWPFVGTYVTTGLKCLLRLSIAWTVRGAALLVGVRIAWRWVLNEVQYFTFPNVRFPDHEVNRVLIVATITAP